MKRCTCLFLIAMLCFSNTLHAQFFYKMDDDFKFNGLNLARIDDNKDPLKGCTLIEHPFDVTSTHPSA